MIVWCIFLFVLGATAFIDALFFSGDIFRGVNSVIFMLIALGLLIRTGMKMKIGRIEKLMSKINLLETGKSAEPDSNSIP
jgi:hypothetical protein